MFRRFRRVAEMLDPGPPPLAAQAVGLFVLVFDAVFTPIRSHLVYCRVERPIRWLIGNPLLFAQIVLYLGIAWGVIGRELGLSELFWHESGWRQFSVGVAVSWLFGVVLFVNILLRGFLPDQLPGLPTEVPWSAKVFGSLFPSHNPGVRRVGRWMLWTLLVLCGLVYLKKLADVVLWEQNVWGDTQGVPPEFASYGLAFLGGYAAGMLIVYLLSLADSWLGFREQVATRAWLMSMGDDERCEEDVPTEPPQPGPEPLPPPPETAADIRRRHNLYTIRLLYAMAVVLGLAILVFWCGLLVRIALFGVQTSPAVILSLLLMAADVVGAFIVFRVRSARSVAVVALALVLLANSTFVVGQKMTFPHIDDAKYEPDQAEDLRGERVYQTRFRDQAPAGGLIDPDAWLATAHANWAKDHPGSRPRVVLVAASGGGIRSAVWTGAVLQELDGLARRNGPTPRRTALMGVAAGLAAPPAPGGRFRDHVRLFAGASGGMVGAAAYAGGFGPDPLPAEGFDTTTGLYPLARALADDALSPVFQTMLVRDFTLSVLSPYPSRVDRGRTLEWAWDENFVASGIPGGSPFARSVRSTKAAEEQCRRPALVFSPVLVEDGRRLLISNVDFGHLTDPTARLTDLGRPAPVALPAVEFFRLFPQASGFKVGTAARMNASFPVISPAVALPTYPTRRAVDAGYFDNYGVDLLCHWLLRHRPAVLAHTSGVMIVQVRGYPLDQEGRDIVDIPQSPTDMLIGAVSAPLQTLTTARGAAAHFRNSALLDVVDRSYNADGRPADFFTTVAFELEGSAALSWHLTTAQKRSVAAGLYAMRDDKEGGYRRPWDLDPAGRPRLRPEARRKLDAVGEWFGDGDGGRAW